MGGLAGIPHHYVGKLVESMPVEVEVSGVSMGRLLSGRKVTVAKRRLYLPGDIILIRARFGSGRSPLDRLPHRAKGLAFDLERRFRAPL